MSADDVRHRGFNSLVEICILATIPVTVTLSIIEIGLMLTISVDGDDGLLISVGIFSYS